MRLLIYSHDSFGLGHLRRCREIAHSLVQHRQDISVLLISGSPIIGRYGFRPRVDFIRIPGVVKTRDGGYTSHALDIGVEDTLAVRESIIRNTAAAFNPDLFLVDKEPLGLRGEVTDTLKMLKGNGTRLVLGLRDIVDEPQALKAEWERKGAIQALEDIYDNIWAYGRPEIYDPLQGLGVSERVRGKISYTGYLRRFANTARRANALDTTKIDEPFILVTPGGGGDGLALVEAVVSAYEADSQIPLPALIISGPFMDVRAQAGFNERISRLPKVYSVNFEANMKNLVQAASAIVAMGGYNTFCEILSFDRPSLLVPRIVPRREQYIRATRARDLGLVNMLEPQAAKDPRLMAAALTRLPHQAPPSTIMAPGLLDGWTSINANIDLWFPEKSAQVVQLRQADGGV